MNRFTQIANDPVILSAYQSVAEFEEQDNGWAHHDYQHVSNVAQMVESLLRNMRCEESFIEEAKIAALLHDVGAAQGKEGHAQRSALFAKAYFEKNEIPLVYKKEILESIRLHSAGFDTENLMTLVLIFSDKLDIKHTRVAKAGRNVPGMRQLCFVNDIQIILDSSTLTIRFLCDKSLDQLELEEFYFTKKVFRAINSFSKKLKLTPVVYLNDHSWQPYSN